MTVPAEWGEHRAMWLGFPSHAELWTDDLAPAQAEVAALALALAGPGGERVKLMVCGESAAAAARALCAVDDIEIIPARFGDIWLRDTGPIFTGDGAAGAFAFNGWGGKYRLAGDECVAGQIAAAAGARLARHGFVLEGGALDHDGAGTVLTTRQCLLNPNRNPAWREADAEAALTEALGAHAVVWLDEGLAGDHTDGHVDNLARFVAPGVVACATASGPEDPNALCYARAAQALAAHSTLRVVRIPSPGLVADDKGAPLAASHMNFIIANGAVVMPFYDEAAGRRAAAALQAEFPGRPVIPLPARALLTGGGAFHCITQQEPA